MNTKVKHLRPTYAEVNLKRYASNLLIAKQYSKKKIIAIVKADAYGHGAYKLADYAMNQKITNIFGVATFAEGLTLREKLGANAEIIILGYVDEEFYPDVVAKNLILTIYDGISAKKYNDFLVKNSLKMPVVFKVDTGMSRLGFDTDVCFSNFTNVYKNFDIRIVMTHLSSSDSDESFSESQISKFQKFLSKNRITCATSAFNSSAIFKYHNTFDFIRPGIVSYGYIYGCEVEGVKPVMSIYSKIAHVKKIKVGESVSYNRKYTANTERTIGVLPVGYADGYPRHFTNKSFVYLGDYKCYNVGTVCMDMIMIDITDVPERFRGEEVELLGDRVTGYKWGKWGDSIIYECLCNISYRVPRVYVE